MVAYADVSDSAVAERSFDVVVIGAGHAGEVVPGRLGEAGVDVALVEQHLVGGECSFSPRCIEVALVLASFSPRSGAFRG